MSRPWQASGRGADLLFLCVSATALSVQVILQHREAQPQPTMHSCHFRSSNESLYHSHHGLVADFASDRAGDRTLVVCVGGEKQATTPHGAITYHVPTAGQNLKIPHPESSSQ